MRRMVPPGFRWQCSRHESALPARETHPLRLIDANSRLRRWRKCGIVNWHSPEQEMNGYNFTERVRRVLSRAREEAVALRHEYVGTEHILLALLEGGGVAQATIENLGVHTADVRKKIIDTVVPGRADSISTVGTSAGILEAIADTIFPRGPDLPYTSRAKKVLELAMTEARTLSHSYVGTEHVLLGVMREARGIGAQVLASFGLSVQGVRDEVLRVLGTEVPERPATMEPRFRDDTPDQEVAITLVVERPDGTIEARKFRRAGDAVAFLNGLER
jgi:ATP-dependent Clp protease ATP-binding subunit ClpA